MAKNYKTIALTGAEQKVTLAGQNCDIRNDSVDVVYASAEAGITSGADGVLSIPAGQAAKLLDCRGTLYILGTGSVMLCGNDYSELVFKTAATSSGEGGGTVDGVARQAIETHANNEKIHLTAEKAIEAAATAISNPNLLINPDFKINQRGQAEYGESYTNSVDGWKKAVPIVITTLNKGIHIYSRDAWDIVYQIVDNYDSYAGHVVTFSVSAASVNNMRCTLRYADSNGDVAETAEAFNGDKAVLTVALPTGITSLWLCIQATAAGAECSPEWAKLELGSVATPFIPPDPATELSKCQRYYQVRSTGDIDPVDLRPSMATITDVRERSDGNYEYIAEL